MDEKLKYLYRFLIRMRTSQGSEMLDLKQLCQELHIPILIMDQPSFFPTGEIAYLVVYPDLKSCMIIHQKLEDKYHNEVIGYLLLRIMLLRQFRDVLAIRKLPNGAIMESYYRNRTNLLDENCKLILDEMLMPSRLLTFSHSHKINTHFIDSMSKKFRVRPEVFLDRYYDLIRSKKRILNASFPSKYKPSSIMKRFIEER